MRARKADDEEAGDGRNLLLVRVARTRVSQGTDNDVLSVDRGVKVRGAIYEVAHPVDITVYHAIIGLPTSGVPVHKCARFVAIDRRGGGAWQRTNRGAGPRRSEEFNEHLNDDFI